MLGAIIGDIIGSRFEFNRTNDYNFELFTDECSFTDDTICTIAVADALLKGKDYGESIHEWCRKYPHPMGGYGMNFRNWVMSDNPKPYGSYGNGSAMRVAPIGWWFEHPHDLFTEAEKSAACTHSHEDGILGAQAVVCAIRDCRELRRDMKGKPITEDNILWGGIDHAAMLYYEFPQNFKLNIEDYRNKFDETCNGTVPPALWIIMHSTSFEDAIRQAVSLGADADTIGAIVGSIAEALWGIPEWMKKKALTYLPKEMRDVVSEFHDRVTRLRKLVQKCEFYYFDEYKSVDEKNQPACEIEKEWAHDLAKSFTNADKIKEEMAKRAPLQVWQDIADDYDLPISLIGYTAKHILTPKHKTFKALIAFLDEHYAKRKPAAAKKKEEKIQKEQFQAMMLWKLGLGHMGKFFNGEPHMPDKSQRVTGADWNLEPMPTGDDISSIDVSIPFSQEQMDIIIQGHLPESQEDHWFMYAGSSHIYYHRSWTGMCAFVAEYNNTGNGYIIHHLIMNHQLCEFGVNGDEAGVALFIYLLTAETGGDHNAAWQDYLNAWDKLNKKYNHKDEQ